MSINNSDILDFLAGLAENSIDAVVSDPPYGLEFMGKAWDGPQNWDPRDDKQESGDGAAFLRAGKNLSAYSAGLPFQQWVTEWATGLLRVVKPGAHGLFFGGTRTVHRLASGLEDAGWEIRDRLSWVYMSGFPKAMDVSKAIDKRAGVEREIIGPKHRPGGTGFHGGPGEYTQVGRGIEFETAPATEEAKRWDGWKTALKPAFEPIILARAPLIGAVVDNVLEHGTGAMNIDATRIGNGGQWKWAEPRGHGWDGYEDSGDGTAYGPNSQGRYPSNFLLSSPGALGPDADKMFLIPKAAANERYLYCRTCAIVAPQETKGAHEDHDLEIHPTVKPVSLMRHLVKLVTPTGGTVIDPFVGTGTTAVAAKLERLQFVGCDQMAEYVAVARERVRGTPAQAKLGDF